MESKPDMAMVTKWHMEMHEKFRHVADSGMEVDYLGKNFIVYRNVFWPMWDSMPMVQNFKINPGEEVLDVCTGSGVIAIFAAYKGAKNVVAVDINPDAIRCARDNAKRHGFADKIDVRLSDVMDALKENEKFDAITMNPPFRDDMIATDFPQKAAWDTNRHVHRKFFADVRKHLKPNGRVYITHSNYGAVDKMKDMAKAAGFDIKLIGQKAVIEPTPRTFYAFELTRK